MPSFIQKLALFPAVLLSSCCGLFCGDFLCEWEMDSWLGKTEEQITAHWGHPNQRYVSEDKSVVLEYTKQVYYKEYTTNPPRKKNITTAKGTRETVTDYNTGGRTEYKTDPCTTLFILKNGKTVRCVYRGDGCCK